MPEEQKPKIEQSDGFEPETKAQETTRKAAYWKKNVQLVLILLSIWFLVSYVAGVLLVDQLDSISLMGFPLGFWFAQQGSIYVFVILIFVYARLMNRLDRRFDVDEK